MNERRDIMKNIKTGITLIILGNILNLSYLFFTGNETSNFGDFSKGLLIGLSIGCNLLGIILMVVSLSKENKSNS